MQHLENRIYFEEIYNPGTGSLNIPSLGNLQRQSSSTIVVKIVPIVSTLKSVFCSFTSTKCNDTINFQNISNSFQNMIDDTGLWFSYCVKYRKLQLISSCGNFVERHSFPIVLCESPKNILTQSNVIQMIILQGGKYKYDFFVVSRFRYFKGTLMQI